MSIDLLVQCPISTFGAYAFKYIVEIKDLMTLKILIICGDA